MPFFTSPVDGANIFYRHYVPDDYDKPSASVDQSFRPLKKTTSDVTLVFLHGWPMSSRMFEHLLLPLCETYRFRCLAPDRRGFGKSDWNAATPATVITWDTFVADITGLLDHLHIKKFVFVGASMGAAESLLSYLASASVQDYCKGFVWIGPAMPYPLSTPEHPLGPSPELWTSILDSLRADRSQFVHESLPGVFALQAGNHVSAKTLENFERIIAEADSLAIEKTCTIINQKPMEAELGKLAGMMAEAPGARRPAVMILHGDSDQGMPLEASSSIIQEMLPRAELKVYARAGHGLYLTHASQVISDLVAFVDKLH